MITVKDILDAQQENQQDFQKFRIIWTGLTKIWYK